MTLIGLPSVWLAAGYGVPDVCVRHGEPAVFRRRIRPVTKPPAWSYLLILPGVLLFLVVWLAVRKQARIADWPFCAHCRARRWAFLAAGLAFALLPGAALFGVALTVPDPGQSEQLGGYAGVATLFGMLTGLAVGVNSAPNQLARVTITDDGAWVLFQQPHPTFTEWMQPVVDEAEAQLAAEAAAASEPATAAPAPVPPA